MTANVQPIRLALCITELDVGGAERCLTELATRLDRARFQPVVYSLAGPPANAARSLVPVLQSAGIEVHCLGARRMTSAGQAVWRLARLLKSQRAEVLQAFLYHANLAGRLAARAAGVRHVFCGIRVAERRTAWRLRADRWTSRMVERYVCVSRDVAEFSRVVGRLPGERIVVIPNGVDVDRFDRAAPADLTQWGLAPGRRAVTFVGRIDPQKGLLPFLEHARTWLDALGSYDLLLVGDGPQRVELTARCRQLGLERRVHFAGWRDDVPAILRASELLVLPSQWEGMPNAVLEAMACGLPVVATDVEGVRELLGEAADEQVAPVGNQALFAEKLVAVASNLVLGRRLGAENRGRARGQFSLDAMVDAYAELYERSVGRCFHP